MRRQFSILLQTQNRLFHRGLANHPVPISNAGLAPDSDQISWHASRRKARAAPIRSRFSLAPRLPGQSAGEGEAEPGRTCSQFCREALRAAIRLPRQSRFGIRALGSVRCRAIHRTRATLAPPASAQLVADIRVHLRVRKTQPVRTRRCVMNDVPSRVVTRRTRDGRVIWM